MQSTRMVRRFKAPRRKVFEALIDPNAIAAWRVPEGMTCLMHEYEPREGGAFRISLTYTTPTATGKTNTNTDTYHGRIVRIVENAELEEVVEFETTERSLQGPMTITYTLRDVEGGTELVALHKNLPPGLSERDNELGWAMSLSNLAKLVER